MNTFVKFKAMWHCVTIMQPTVCTELVSIISHVAQCSDGGCLPSK